MRNKKIYTLVLFFSLFLWLQMLGIQAADYNVVVTNEKQAQPDLYVTKKVESLVPGYTPAADQEFTFTIQVEEEGSLQPYKNERYQVFNQDGSEVIEKDAMGNTIAHCTDDQGKFKLKDGETAYFEYVGKNLKYEVTEEEQENFQTIAPVGGTATGLIDANGTQVLFRNQYIPTEDPPAGTPIELQVKKYVVHMDGYEVPEDDTEFEYTIKIDGTEYANQQYVETKIDDDSTRATKTTNADGKFTLKGGYQATFSDIESGVDYEVTESAATGWWCLDNTTQEGATTGPVTVTSYRNSQTSFIVAKTLRETLPFTDKFTFYLKDKNKAPMKDVSYYLYNADGTLVEKEPKQTGEDGSFELSGGQRAMFIGIPPETMYSVSEKEDGSYKQVVPTSTSGYENQTVSTIPAIHNFENRRLGSIKIVKFGNDGKTPLSGVEFVLSNETTEITKTTDKNGEITFEGLDPGSYSLKETKTVNGYQLLAKPVHIMIPMTMSQDQVDRTHADTTKAVYDTTSNTYYFYDLTYHITNDAQLIMPTSGSYGYWKLGIVGFLIILTTVFVVLKPEKRNRRKESIH